MFLFYGAVKKTYLEGCFFLYGNFFSYIMGKFHCTFHFSCFNVVPTHSNRMHMINFLQMQEKLLDLLCGYGYSIVHGKMVQSFSDGVIHGNMHMILGLSTRRPRNYMNLSRRRLRHYMVRYCNVSPYNLFQMRSV